MYYKFIFSTTICLKLIPWNSIVIGFWFLFLVSEILKFSLIWTFLSCLSVKRCAKFAKFLDVLLNSPLVILWMFQHLLVMWCEHHSSETRRKAFCTKRMMSAPLCIKETVYMLSLLSPLFSITLYLIFQSQLL